MGYTVTNGKEFTYYTMDPEHVFGSSATIIEKEGKGILVDTQFSIADAREIVKVAKEKNIDIEVIYNSYSDSDFYFGTDEVVKAFPNAKVVATESTIERIAKTHEAKLSVWGDVLKENRPEKIIIPTEVKGTLSLGGTEIILFGSDEKKQTVYVPSDKVLLGGILVSTDAHLFMADTKTIASQEQWLQDLEELSSLDVDTVIPVHFGQGNKFTVENIRFAKEYIRTFIEVEKESSTSVDIIDKMKERYPNLAEGSLAMSAQVVTGEMAWD